MSVSNERLRKVDRYMNEHPSLNKNAIAEYFNVSPDTIRRYKGYIEDRDIYQEEKEEDTKKQEEELERFIDDLGDKDEVEFWRSFSQYQEAAQKVEPRVPVIEAEVESDHAYLVGWGDWHIENIGSNIERLESDLKCYDDLDDKVSLFLGDGSDNAVNKYPDSSFETLAPPHLSRKLVLMALRGIRGTLVGMISGCHEEHGRQQADFDYIEELSTRWNIDYLGYQGMVNLTVGDVEYKIFATHKGKGYSMYNPFHGGVRFLWEEYPQANISMIGHHHQSGAAVQPIQGKQKAIVAIGTYKTGDKYSRRRNFPQNIQNLQTPVLELDGEKRGYKIYPDIRDIDPT